MFATESREAWLSAHVTYLVGHLLELFKPPHSHDPREAWLSAHVTYLVGHLLEPV